MVKLILCWFIHGLNEVGNQVLVINGSAFNQCSNRIAWKVSTMHHCHSPLPHTLETSTAFYIPTSLDTASTNMAFSKRKHCTMCECGQKANQNAYLDEGIQVSYFRPFRDLSCFAFPVKSITNNSGRQRSSMIWCWGYLSDISSSGIRTRTWCEASCTGCWALENKEYNAASWQPCFASYSLARHFRTDDASLSSPCVSRSSEGNSPCTPNATRKSDSRVLFEPESNSSEVYCYQRYI